MINVIEHWNNRNAGRKKTPSSEYNKRRHIYLRSLINKKRGVALKVDLWNEGGNKGCFDINLFKSFKVIGMDISRIACINATKENPWINIMNLTLAFLPFKDGSIDVILDISTSDHMPLNKFSECFENYSRILTEKGELLLIFNNRLPGTEEKTEPYTYWFNHEEVRTIISKHFDIEILKPYGTHPNELKHFLLKAVKK